MNHESIDLSDSRSTINDQRSGDPGRLRLLLIAPYFDKNVAGESWCTYKWVQGICERTEATVITTHTPNWDPAKSPIQAKELVNWTHKKFKGRLARFDNEFKPHYLAFYRQARKWIKQRLATGQSFDLIHQINPVALRYPSPAIGLGIPYILGPQAGSLPTPEGFKSECGDSLWFRRFRNLDAWRIRFDPWLRRSFSNASLVLGVAPYVHEFLAPAKIKQFHIMAETGPDEIISTPESICPPSRPLRLLFVGRIIRTKGVFDAIRAVAIAAKTANITFDIIGEGDMLETCEQEARNLGISNIANFHGRIPRSEVFEWYRKSDVFLFPSFREPSGTVVFEALGFGLPLITCDNGGPGYVITPECGRLVKAITPAQYAQDIAQAIIELEGDRSLIPNLARGALARVEQVSSWENRLGSLIQLYRSCLESNPSKPFPSCSNA